MNHDRESDGEVQQRRRVCELVDSLVTGALQEGIEPAALARETGTASFLLDEKENRARRYPRNMKHDD
jgi:hypothetical protein